MPSKTPSKGLQTLPDKRGKIKNCTQEKSYPCGKACLGIGSAILEGCLKGLKPSSGQKATELAQSLLKKGNAKGSSGNGLNPSQKLFDTNKDKVGLQRYPKKALVKDKKEIDKVNLTKLIEYGNKQIDAILEKVKDDRDLVSEVEKKYNQSLTKLTQKYPNKTFPPDEWKAHYAIEQEYAKEIDKFNEKLDKILEDYRQTLLSQSEITEEEAQHFAQKKIEYGKNIESAFNKSAYRKPELQRDIAEVYRLSNGIIGLSLKKVDYTDDRAWASKYDKSINMGIVKPKENSTAGEENKRRIMYHELAHHVEYSLEPEAQASIKEWLESRAEGKPKQINKLVKKGKYGSDEKAYPDKFIDPYVGKVYMDLGKGSSEVLSMGVQHFAYAKDMRKLLAQDPEHFALVLGLLKTTKEL